MAPEASPARAALKPLDFIVAAIIFFGILVESLHTIHAIGPSWDEPVYFHYAKAIEQWLLSLGSGSAFSQAALERVFGMSVLNYSPPLAKALGMLTMITFQRELGEFWSYRMYAPILFALLMTLIYFRASLAWGRPAGIASVLCVFCLPRLFAEGHIGATETPLCFFWFLAVVVFEASFRRPRLAPIAGVCYGLAMSVKFTGWLLAVPLLLQAVLFHRKKIFYPALWLLVGPLVFILLQPFLWRHPMDGLMDFLRLSLSRQATHLVPVLFRGKFYPFSAPWYYAPYMTLVTTPVVTLVLFLAGVLKMAAARFKDELAGACLVNFLFFIALMMSPGAPSYDGVRLFVPAFIFLGMLAGNGWVGIGRWVRQLARGSNALKKITLDGRLAQALVVIALGFGVIYPLIKIYPYGLEYYNELVKGPAGARRRGLETTYWWTVVNDDALARIDRALPPGASLLCWPAPAKIGEFYEEIGLLRKDVRITYEKNFDYLLVLSRPTDNFQPTFAYLHVAPAQLKAIASDELDGVPLWVLYKREHGPDQP